MNENILPANRPRTPSCGEIGHEVLWRLGGKWRPTERHDVSDCIASHILYLR